MLLNENYELALQTVLDRVEQKYKVAALFLSGSRMYGYAKDDSDYDFVAYVFPRKEDLVSSVVVSEEMRFEEDYLDSVKVKDFRTLYKDLTKPSFNSLHLLTEPVYVDKKHSLENLLNKETVEDYFKLNKKNLLFSLAGTYHSHLEKYGNKYEYDKENARLFYLYCMFDRVFADDYRVFLDSAQGYRKRHPYNIKSGFVMSEELRLKAATFPGVSFETAELYKYEANVELKNVLMEAFKNDFFFG